MKGSFRSRLGVLVFAATMVLALAGSVSAGPIDGFINGPWLEFGFNGPNTAAYSCPSCTPSGGGNSVFLDAPAWTYTSAAHTVVNVTDAFLHGDTFALFDFGVFVGRTPFVVADSTGSGPDPTNPAFTSLDPLYSHEAFVLGPGAHALSLEVIDSPYGSGAAFFRVTPEPGTLLLLGSGLLAAGWWKRGSSRARRPGN